MNVDVDTSMRPTSFQARTRSSNPEIGVQVKTLSKYSIRREV